MTGQETQNQTFELKKKYITLHHVLAHDSLSMQAKKLLHRGEVSTWSILRVFVGVTTKKWRWPDHSSTDKLPLLLGKQHGSCLQLSPLFSPEISLPLQVAPPRDLHERRTETETGYLPVLWFQKRQRATTKHFVLLNAIQCTLKQISSSELTTW